MRRILALWLNEAAWWRAKGDSGQARRKLADARQLRQAYGIGED